jgi:septal ring factor EnvC (AmiA/AmiB activator)
MSDQPATTSGHQVPSVAATAPTTPPAAEAMVALIQATTGTVLGPLVGEVAASRQTIERQADRVAELERENGRQAAELERAASIAVKLSDELDVARAQISTLEAQRAPHAVEVAPRPLADRFRTSAPWLLLVVILLLAVVVGQPAWVR